MTDLFDEVEEQLRTDRYKELGRKFLPWMIGIAAAALLAALAYWGWDYYQRQVTSKASDTYAEAMTAMQAGDRDKARQLWGEVAKSPAGGYKSLALMHMAAFAQEANNRAESVKLLDQAAEAAPEELIGDMARLKSAFALLDTAPYKEVEGRLTPLMEPGRPYALQAREALAFAKLNAGNTKGARDDFLVLSRSLGATEGLQQRASAAMAMIDSGAAKALPAIVKAAVAVPPPVTITPGGTVVPQGPMTPPPQVAPQGQPGAAQ